MDVLLGELLAVKPVTPSQMLPNEGNGHGCLIGIKLGHIEVIHKVHKLLVARRSIIDTRLQQNHPHYHPLQSNQTNHADGHALLRSGQVDMSDTKELAKVLQ